MNPDKTNGSAFVGVVCHRMGPASKAIRMNGCGLAAVGRGRIPLLHHFINIIFRSFGLLPGLAMCRGVTCTVRMIRGDPGIVRGHMLRILSLIKLGRGIQVFPGRLSNKRRRQVTVTHTVTGVPNILVTSRPANGLSPSASVRVVQVLRRVGGRKAAVLVTARGDRVIGSVGRHMLTVRGNHVIQSRRRKRCKCRV